ncbi:MAG: MerR family transcriptional regulator [Planctomycetota bacterium]|jgi:hypothetical protein
METIDRRAEDPVISIGTLARKVGVSVSTVRKYEQEGLLISHRAPSGHRLFSLEDVSRVMNIHHMIRELGLNIEGIRRLQAMLPCWNLYPCGKEAREECEAYTESTLPCWMIKCIDCSNQDNGCRNCIIYRFGSLCTEDIKRLLQDEHSSQNIKEAIIELLKKRRG